MSEFDGAVRVRVVIGHRTKESRVLNGGEAVLVNVLNTRESAGKKVSLRDAGLAAAS